MKTWILNIPRLWRRVPTGIGMLFGLWLLVGTSWAQTPVPPPAIVAAEYYFDTDPGVGAGVPLTVPPGVADPAELTLTAEITIPATLPIGPHTLYVRMKSAADVWGLARAHPVLVTGEEYIRAAEYFIDEDPGVGRGVPMIPADGVFRSIEEVAEAVEVPTANLSVGLHTVFVRAQDQDLRWGLAKPYLFEVLPPALVASAEYQLSETYNPDGTWLPFPPVAGSGYNQDRVELELELDTRTLPRGSYSLWMRGKDQAGRVTGEPKQVRFEVLKEPASLPVVSDQLVRVGGVVSVPVSAGGGGGGSYSLGAGAPSGLTIDAASGRVSWAPGAGVSAGNHPVTVVYTDAGVPVQRVTTSFTVTVDPATGGPLPEVVSAMSLTGSGEVDVRFNRPLDLVSAREASQYTVNGVPPGRVEVRADGRSVVLGVGAVSGPSFALSVRGVKDALGKEMVATNLTGVVLGLRSIELGGSGGVGGGVFGSGPDSMEVWSSGGGFTGVQDQGRFVYEELSGDFEVRVQVERLQSVDYLSAAGLMIRETLEGSSREAGVMFRVTGAEVEGTNTLEGVRVVGVSRGAPGAVVRHVSGGSVAVFPSNAWVRVERVGSVMRGYYGTNGATWTLVMEEPMAWGSRVLVGMAVAGGAGATAPAQATFRNYGSMRPVIVTPPLSQGVAEGADVVFGVTARGAGPLTYQWFFNGAPLSGATGRLLELPGVKAIQSGDYRVEVKNGLGAVMSPAAVLTVGGGGSGGFEGDVFPRPNGDNAVTVSDWVQVGRFVAGIDPLSENERKRADCAPRDTGGDGRLTVMDWAQVARYAIGLDPIRAVGPLNAADRGASAAAAASAMAQIGGARRLEVGSVQVGGRGEVEVPVTLECRGEENALGFSLHFDAGLLRYRGIRVAEEFAGALLQANASGADQGRLGVVFGMPAGVGMGPGVKRLVWVRFELLFGTGGAVLTLADGPVKRELVDADIRGLRWVAVDGGISVVSAGLGAALDRVAGGKLELGFATVPGGTYHVEQSSDLVRWEPIGLVRASGVQHRLEVPAGVSAGFYRVRRVE